MSEAKNVEAELAEVITNTSGMTDVPVLLTIHDEESAIFAAKRIARALLKAGYAKRSDVLEEAAKVAKGPWPSVSQYDERSPRYGADLNPDRSDYGRGKQAGRQEAEIAIRSLKGQP